MKPLLCLILCDRKPLKCSKFLKPVLHIFKCNIEFAFYVPTTAHKMDVTSMSFLQPCWHDYGWNASTLLCSPFFQLISSSVVNAVIGAPSYTQVSCAKIETICKSRRRQSPEVIEIIKQERCCSHHFHKAIRKLALMNTGQILLPATYVAGWLVL